MSSNIPIITSCNLTCSCTLGISMNPICLGKFSWKRKTRVDVVLYVILWKSSIALNRILLIANLIPLRSPWYYIILRYYVFLNHSNWKCCTDLDETRCVDSWMSEIVQRLLLFQNSYWIGLYLICWALWPKNLNTGMTRSS